MRLYALTLSVFLPLAAGASPPSGEFAPDDLHRVQVYDGVARPAGQVATLFTMDGRPHGESATMCEIDGVSLERDGVCASVAYVLPGRHAVRLRYASAQQFGSGTATLVASAGRLYQINFSSLNINYSARVTVIPMYEGARLTWRNLAPGLSAGSERIDEPVPPTANAALAAPAPPPPLSQAEKDTVDHVVACAAVLATDVDVRKADHQEYASGFRGVGDFVRIAQDYLSESTVRMAFNAARADKARAYRAALDATQPGSVESAASHQRLADEVAACGTFRLESGDVFAARARLLQAQ